MIGVLSTVQLPEAPSLSPALFGAGPGARGLLGAAPHALKDAGGRQAGAVPALSGHAARRDRNRLSPRRPPARQPVCVRRPGDRHGSVLSSSLSESGNNFPAVSHRNSDQLCGARS
eukprot:scaffold47258_cov21-Prasinocladus_malaysianus.AAC.2